MLTVIFTFIGLLGKKFTSIIKDERHLAILPWPYSPPNTPPHYKAGSRKQHYYGELMMVSGLLPVRLCPAPLITD